MTQKPAASLSSTLFARKGKASPASLLISELGAGAQTGGRAANDSARRRPRAEPELPLLAFVEEQIEAETGATDAVEDGAGVEEFEAPAAAPPAGPAPAASLLERGARPLRRVNGHAAAEPAFETEAPAQPEATKSFDDPEEGGVQDPAMPETVSGDANVAAIEDAPEEGGDSLAATAPETPPEEPAATFLETVLRDGVAPEAGAAAAKAPDEQASAGTPPRETVLPRKTEAAMAASVALRHAQSLHAGASRHQPPQEETPPPAPAALGPLWRAAAVLVLGAGLGFGAYLALAGKPAEMVPVQAALPPAPPTHEPAPAEPAAPAPAASLAVPAPSPAAPPTVGPASSAAVAELPEPSFDVIRIEPDGQSIIAGRAEPFSEWILLNNDTPIASLRADANGEWVVLPDASLVPGANAFSLVPKSERGKVAIPAPEPATPAPQSDAGPAEAAPDVEAPRRAALDRDIVLPQPKPETPEAATLPAAPLLSPGGVGYEVQLASVRQNSDALRERDRLAEDFPELLGGLELRVEEAAVDGAGTFYRVRTAALADLGIARAICRRLEAGGQGCLVVRRAAAPAPAPATELAEEVPAEPASAAGQQAERP